MARRHRTDSYSRGGRFSTESAHALLTIFRAGDFQHRVQLLLVTFVGAIPVPIHFYQALGLAHGEIGFAAILPASSTTAVEELAMGNDLFD